VDRVRGVGLQDRCAQLDARRRTAGEGHRHQGIASTPKEYQMWTEPVLLGLDRLLDDAVGVTAAPVIPIRMVPPPAGAACDLARRLTPVSAVRKNHYRPVWCSSRGARVDGRDLVIRGGWVVDGTGK